MRGYYPSSFDRINVVTDPDQRIRNAIAHAVEDARFSPSPFPQQVEGVTIKRHDALGFNVTLGDSTRYFPNNRAGDAQEYILGLIKSARVQQTPQAFDATDVW